jgi:uncharacterized protein YegJ (DUF2314 family)
MKIILLVLGAVIVVGMLLLFLRRRRTGGDRPLTALVFLMSRAHPLTEEQVRQAMTKTWGVELGSEMQPEGDWLGDGGKVNPAMASSHAQNFLARANGRMFLINSVSKPYMDDPEKEMAAFPDIRLRQAIGNHRAWISVDLFGETPAAEEKPEVYATLARLLVEFANDDCLAVYCPALGRCNEYAPAVLEALASGNPLDLFKEPTNAPVVEIDGNDPRMIAALEEARRRWPEFVEAFSRNTDAEAPFAVKARFADVGHEEFMWVSVQQIDDDVITGKLGNSPATLKHVKEGDIVTVCTADLNDWIYVSGDQQVGGFTMKVMEEEIQK